nr:unnamed protein product [Callosobruchus analis]
MEDLRGILTDDDDMLELLDILNRRRARKRYRERINHFKKWNDEEFRQRFRLSKQGVLFVLENITANISHPTQRNHAVSAEIMLLVTLRYLATGSFLVVVGDFVGIDKSTACRIVYKVCRAIAGLHTTFIRMPVTDDEAHINSNRFYNIARFPRCIGAIDCTHVRISSPEEINPKYLEIEKTFFRSMCKLYLMRNSKYKILCADGLAQLMIVSYSTIQTFELNLKEENIKIICW